MKINYAINENPQVDSIDALRRYLLTRDSEGFNAIWIMKDDKDPMRSSILAMFNGNIAAIDYWDSNGHYFGSAGDRIGEGCAFRDNGICFGTTELSAKRLVPSDLALRAVLDFFMSAGDDIHDLSKYFLNLFSC